MSEPKRLVIDAAAPRSVVGLTHGNRLVAERFNDVPKRHAEVLAANIDEVLAAGGTRFGELDEIIVGHGPGSFIGIRVALSTALGAGTALRCPVIGVCSVGALVTKSGTPPNAATTLCVLDARKGELYVRAMSRAADRSGAHDPLAIAPQALGAYLRTEGVVPAKVVGAVHLVPENVPGERTPRAGAHALGLLWARLVDDHTQTKAPIVARYCRAPDARRPTLAPARRP